MIRPLTFNLRENTLGAAIISPASVISVLIKMEENSSAMQVLHKPEKTSITHYLVLIPWFITIVS